MWAGQCGICVEAHGNSDGLVGSVDLHESDAPRLADVEQLGIQTGITHTPNLRTTHTIWGSAIRTRLLYMLKKKYPLKKELDNTRCLLYIAAGISAVAFLHRIVPYSYQ